MESRAADGLIWVDSNLSAAADRGTVRELRSKTELGGSHRLRRRRAPLRRSRPAQIASRMPSPAACAANRARSGARIVAAARRIATAR